MPEIQSSSTGLSGEYFVAAELLRRGYSVGITMGNAKAIDFLAEKDGKQFIIQVKAIFKNPIRIKIPKKLHEISVPMLKFLS